MLEASHIGRNFAKKIWGYWYTAGLHYVKYCQQVDRDNPPLLIHSWSGVSSSWPPLYKRGTDILERVQWRAIKKKKIKIWDFLPQNRENSGAIWSMCMNTWEYILCALRLDLFSDSTKANGHKLKQWSSCQDVTIFYCEGDWAVRSFTVRVTGCKGKVWSFGDIQKPYAHRLCKPVLGIPPWAEESN